MGRTLAPITLAVVMASLAATGCIPTESDFILIPSVTGASGEVTTADPASITVRMTVLWENGDEAPETTVTVDSRVSMEDDDTQDFLGRISVDRTTAFDNLLGPGERVEVGYEGVQSPPIEADPAELCDGRRVHLQVIYDTHGAYGDGPQTALSNGFAFACD